MANTHKKTILSFLLCIASFGAIAQTADEQLKKYIDEANKAQTDEEFLAAMNSADSFCRKTNNIAAQAQVNREMGSYFFDKDPDESVKYGQKAYRLYLSAGNKKAAAICLNNLAFAYEEKKDYAEAMKYAKRAITAHTELKDTLNMANVYKYQGMLYGKLHDYPNGKKSVAKAIQLFSTKDDQAGVAVSYFDLATVFEEEHEYDSSITWILKAKEIWANYGNNAHSKSRIYGNNTSLIRLYAKTGKMSEADTLIHENEKMDATGFHYSDHLRFYKEAKDFYTKNKDKENANTYRDKYSELREGLKAEGKNVD